MGIKFFYSALKWAYDNRIEVSGPVPYGNKFNFMYRRRNFCEYPGCHMTSKRSPIHCIIYMPGFIRYRQKYPEGMSSFMCLTCVLKHTDWFIEHPEVWCETGT